MEEVVNALRSENDSIKRVINTLHAEKVALDQMLVDTLKSTLDTKKQLILKDQLLKEKECEAAALQSEIDRLKGELAKLSEAPNENTPSS